MGRVAGLVLVLFVYAAHAGEQAGVAPVPPKAAAKSPTKALFHCGGALQNNRVVAHPYPNRVTDNLHLVHLDTGKPGFFTFTEDEIRFHSLEKRHDMTPDNDLYFFTLIDPKTKKENKLNFWHGVRGPKKSSGYSLDAYDGKGNPGTKYPVWTGQPTGSAERDLILKHYEQAIRNLPQYLTERQNPPAKHAKMNPPLTTERVQSLLSEIICTCKEVDEFKDLIERIRKTPAIKPYDDDLGCTEALVSSIE